MIIGQNFKHNKLSVLSVQIPDLKHKNFALKKSLTALLKWWRIGDCLDLFAINVSADCHFQVLRLLVPSPRTLLACSSE